MLTLPSVLIYIGYIQIFLLLTVETTFDIGAQLMESMRTPDDQNNCEIGYFHCNTSLQCVPQRMNCDGSADCEDASDEWDCENEVDAIFWDHLFRKQPFGRNDEIQAGACYWNTSWTKCPCRGDEVLCGFQNLEGIPKLLPNFGIRMLDLSGNNFSFLDETFFEALPDVETLVLKFCSIGIIYPNAFKRLSKINLETIFLDQNHLRQLPEDLFPKLNNLKVLILSGNEINRLFNYNFKNLENLNELDLRNNQLEVFDEEVFQPLTSLEILYLNENRIHFIAPGMFSNLKHLCTLSLANNLIVDIERNSFPFPRLEHLFLASNRLTHIKSDTFCNLTMLKGLHLNDNQIVSFENGAFNCLDNLTSLLLSDNKFRTINKLALQNLSRLNYVYFSWFHLCQAATHVRVCEPKGDGISSTHHLLDNKVLRGSVWVMATVAIVGNVTVLLGRYFHRNRSNVEHSLYLTHLAASDLLMGIYLAIIASADIKFRGSYIFHEEEWRHSLACALCGFLSTLSCQSSTLLLTLVTWDRLMSVTRPLQTRNASKSTAAVRLTSMWTISLVLAVAPLALIPYFGQHFYGNNGVCLSLHIHEPYAKGWEYSAALFICLNTLSLIFISFSYLKMLRAIRDSGCEMRSTLSRRENLVARRFAVIVATDCVCWLPIIIVKLSALYGVKIPSSLYAWLAVLVLPVNSALNPILYTLTTATFKQQIRRYIKSLRSRQYHDRRSPYTIHDSCQLSASFVHFGNSSARGRLLHIKTSIV